MSAEWLREITDRLRGRKIAGGCDECNAYQMIEEDAFGIFHIRVAAR
jgi:hypothetical protein